MDYLASWKEHIEAEMQKDYFIALSAFLTEQEKHKEVFPPKEHRLAALNYVSFKEVRVIILGQDPYHGQGQAHGLSFSVPDGVKPPPSLKNVFKEIEQDTGIKNESGCLKPWADQGVLLLNRSLTVEKQQPGSHSNIGWEKFTYALLEFLVQKRSGLIFVAWGRAAESAIKPLPLKERGHHVLISAHPSPFSYHKFKGCGHFSRINGILKSRGEKEIDWSTDAAKNKKPIGNLHHVCS